MKSYLINLSSRVDRLEESKKEFSRLGIEFDRFPAILNDNPIISFNLSQYACIKAGYDSGEDIFFVYEDDVIFDSPFSKVEEAMRDLPYGWVSLYLGANITTETFQPPERVSSKLVRLRDAWQSHAIAYSHRGADYILTQFKPLEGIIFDEWMRRIMKEGNIYMMSPMAAYQRPSFSNIWQIQTDYTGVHPTGNRMLQMI